MCAFCRRVRTMFFGRTHRCEACEKAMRAVRQHERSTQNLTRAALDGIDWTVGVMGDGESENDIRTLVDDMLRSLEPAQRREKGSQS
jgi:hypothetical protein